MKWLALGLFAVLPLQWFALGATPVGQGRLHQVAILGFTLIVLLRYRHRTRAPLIGTAAPFIVATIYMLATWAAADLYNGVFPRGSAEQLLYLGAFIAIGTYFYRVASRHEPDMVEAFRWTAAIVCVTVIVSFSISMALNGVNPAAVLAKTVAAADPELFQKEVFKSSFAGFGLDAEAVKGNLRHEVFGSVLLAMFVSAWAMRFGPAVTAAQRKAYRAGMIVGVALLVVSLSRSVLIAAALWPLIGVIKAMARGGPSIRQVTVIFVSLVAVGALALSGFGSVLWNRFTVDTTGYDTRGSLYANAFEDLRNHWVIGGVDTSGESSHNFILDNWLRGGVFTAMAATAIAVLLLALWFGLVARLHTLPDWMVPIAAALALPLVRLGTSGGGLIAPIGWVTLAFVAGVLTYHRRQSSLLTDTEPVAARDRMDLAR